MKKLIVLTSIVALTGAVLGQGTVNFQTIGGGVNAQVLTAAGVGAESDYFGQLFAGPSADSLAPMGAPRAFTQQGYFGPQSVTIDNISAGGAAFVQLRAWAAANGSTWDAATSQAVYEAGVSPTLALSGTGNPTASPPTTPVNLVGLQGFQMEVIPEPSTWALLALGLGALALRRRKSVGGGVSTPRGQAKKIKTKA
jgi:microcompartment protein CcmK/EutM